MNGSKNKINLTFENGDNNMERKLRKDCFWGMHSDFHAHPNYGVVVGATLKEEDIRTICEKAKPDFIQIDCKGHPGYASYPTEIGNAMPMAFDTLELWRRITKEYGIPLYMHFSGVADVKYCVEHPDDATMTADGNLSSSVRLDSEGKYLDEYFIPQICELAEKYEIDGIWVDGECWAVKCDYRPETIARFEAETGISLNGFIPVKKGDPYYDDYLEFTRNQYRRYINYYVDKLHEKLPNLEICSNWAFSNKMPEPVCANLDFLSGDLEPDNCVNTARYSGRMLAIHNKPWDLMSWGFRFNIYGVPLTPPKYPCQLMQEAAAVISLGGAYQNNIVQFSDGSPDIDRILMNIPLAEFVRERRPYCHGGKIINQAAMLISSFDRYKEFDTPFFEVGAEKLIGLTALLCDSGESLSAINEKDLDVNIGKYPLIILPELHTGIEEKTVETLRSYVLNGGSLIAVGTKTVKLLSDFGFPYTVEEYREYPYTPGWQNNFKGFIKQHIPFGKNPAYFSVDGGPDFGVTVGAYTLKAENMAVIATLHSSFQDKNGQPFAAVMPYGKGKLGIIGADLGTQYHEGAQHQHRVIIRKMADMLYDPIAKVESSTGICEIVCLSVNGEFMLQILNSEGSHRDIHVSTVTNIPPIENVTISIRGDYNVDEVILQPEGVKLETYKEGGRTFFKIPRVDIHSVAHIRVK